MHPTAARARHSLVLIVFATVVCLLAAATTADAGIVIDSGSARATLNALGRKDLSLADALAVADLPGNQAMVRKLNEFGGPTVTREDFANDLLAAAHGTTAPDPFRLVRVRDGRTQTLALLDRIAHDPQDFDGWIAQRVKRFSPAALAISATGYLIAGGQATGFSFDQPIFYLDISQFGDDFGGARVIMAHELYHAVQNIAQAAYAKGVVFDYDAAAYNALPQGRARSCYAIQAFFGQLLAEGTATYVGDPALLPVSGVYSSVERKSMRATLSPLTPRSMSSQRTLLEMSVRTIVGSDPLSEKDVYAVGFYDTAPLYDIGYAMAKTIVAHDGDAALGKLISQPGSAFVARYDEIADAPGSGLPTLGAQTEAWARPESCQKE
jgi:hypothetical protein